MEGGPRVLPSYPEDLSAKAEALVTKLGVEVRKDTLVTKIDTEGVDFKHGSSTGRFAAKTVIWTGGVNTTSFGRRVAERTQAETDRAGKIKVNPDLTVPGFPDIFVAGDLADAKNEHGKPLPGVAQVAIQGGRYFGKVMLARLANKPIPPPFRYFDKGDLAVIGRAAAVANIFGLHVTGLLAWLVWLFIHLMYIVEFQSRVLVFIQ
jgi:NADH dehydrogenase